LRACWYILLVKQGFEQTIRDQLIDKQKELGFNEVTISEDLSGYVFIRSIEIKQVGNYLVFDGTLRFLGSKKEGPKKFSTSQINKLNVEPKKQYVEYKKGDHVIIKHGDLSDIDGIIVEIRKRVVKIRPAVLDKIVKVRVRDIEFI